MAEPLLLVVEDDETLRESVAELLREQGYQVLEAANGREALAVLARSRPALVLLDLIMPEMNGWQFLGALAEHPSMSELPVIVTTATPERAPTEVNAVLTKPFEPFKLLELIEQHADTGD